MTSEGLTPQAFLDGASKTFRQLNRLLPVEVSGTARRPVLEIQSAAGLVTLTVTPRLSDWRLKRHVHTGVVSKADYRSAGFDGPFGRTRTWSPVELATYLAAEAARDVSLIAHAMYQQAPLNSEPSEVYERFGLIRAEAREWTVRLPQVTAAAPSTNNEWTQVALETALSVTSIDADEVISPELFRRLP
ncbi:hypothetical protein [Curtobacterium sp. NPDC089689]|uniref:hypothetical protein n=1 Tax=Curtobacterium sp. NPDC089689 TaxID=3363968 RepID=UPI00382B783B